MTISIWEVKVAWAYLTLFLGNSQRRIWVAFRFLKVPAAGRMCNHKPFDIGWKIQLFDSAISSNLLDLLDHFGISLWRLFDAKIAADICGFSYCRDGEDTKASGGPVHITTHLGTPVELKVGHTFKAFWAVSWTKGGTTQMEFFQVAATMVSWWLPPIVHFLVISRGAWLWKARTKAHCKPDWSLRPGFAKLHYSVRIPCKPAQNQPMDLPKPSIQGPSMAVTFQTPVKQLCLGLPWPPLIAATHWKHAFLNRIPSRAKIMRRHGINAS